MEGIIKNIIIPKYFGFIRSGSVEYFFHRSDFQGDWDALIYDISQPNHHIKVSFEVVESPKGPRASEVRRLN